MRPRPAFTQDTLEARLHWLHADVTSSCRPWASSRARPRQARVLSEAQLLPHAEGLRPHVLLTSHSWVRIPLLPLRVVALAHRGNLPLAAPPGLVNQLRHQKRERAWRAADLIILVNFCTAVPTVAF